MPNVVQHIIKQVGVIFSVILIVISCHQEEDKEIVLLADREAPLGWMFLRIYKNKTFEFESRGLERRGDIYSGNIEMKNDTIYFKYSDSIPTAGSKAILTERYISYFDGEYPERLEIKKNELKTQ